MSTALDGAALLAAVLDEPGDDLPRLAYADWCDESGQPERAEFVRVQLKIAGRLKREAGERIGALLKRERQLLGEDVSTEPGIVCPRYHVWCRRSGIDPAWIDSPGFSAETSSWRSFSRGFVASVSLTLADFLAHAAALFSAHPIEEVRLVDRRPHLVAAREPEFWWYGCDADELDEWRTDPAHLPPELFRLLWDSTGSLAVNHPNEASAVNDLAQAALAFGRSLRRR